MMLLDDQALVLPSPAMKEDPEIVEKSAALTGLVYPEA